MPAKPFIMLERQGNSFKFYEKAHALEDWTLVATVDRPDLDAISLQVGIVQACYSANTPVSELDNFNLEGPNLNPPGKPAPATGITLARNGIGKINVGWTPGAGSKGSLVLAHPVIPPTRQPVAGTSYTANADFQQGEDMGATNIVVYAGTGNSVTVTGLSPLLYHFAVYAYAEVNNGLLYSLTTPAASSIEALGPPAITEEPASKTFYAGRTVQIKGIGSGTSPLRYQWRKGGVILSDGENISGATTAILTLSNVKATDAGSYTLDVANDAGSVTSNPAVLTVVAPSGKPFETAVMSYSPVAYWRFSEASGATTAFDYWGGYDGAYGGGNTLEQAGPTPANGFSIFETSNKSVLIPGTASPSPITLPALNLNTNTVTITCWIKPTTAPNSDRAGLLMCGAPTGSGLRYATGGTNLAFLWNGGMVGNSTLAIPAGQWSFVALTMSAKQAILFLGNSGGWQTWTNNADYPSVSFNSSSWIGSDRLVGGRDFDGLIDEVGVFNYTLTPNQVHDLYQGVSRSPDVRLNATRSVGNLILSWPSGVLMQAAEVTGPWTTNNNTSPYTVTPTASRQYYRVKVQ